MGYGDVLVDLHLDKVVDEGEHNEDLNNQVGSLPISAIEVEDRDG